MSDMSSNEITAILESLEGAPLLFEGLLRSVSEEDLGKVRGEGFWSVHEHAAHLADVQPMILERLQRIMTEDQPEFIPFIPEQDAAPEPAVLPPVNAIISQFAAGRAKQVSLLQAASAADWTRKAIHPEYAQYGLLILARHILMHDHWHMYRMEELWLTRDEYLTRLEG